MKQIITLFLVLSSFFVNAQENNQFTVNFSKFAKIVDGEYEEIQNGNVTIVFNYGLNNNIKFYYTDGRTCMYSRISRIIRDTTKDGTKYQYSKVLDEEGEGEEFYLVKHEDGEVRLLYINSFTDKKGFGIVLYP